MFCLNSVDLAVEGVGPDGGKVGPVPGGPAVGSGAGIQEEKGVAHGIGAIQAELGGDDAFGVGLQPDAAVGGGSELY